MKENYLSNEESYFGSKGYDITHESACWGYSSSKNIYWRFRENSY